MVQKKKDAPGTSACCFRVGGYNFTGERHGDGATYYIYILYIFMFRSEVITFFS